MSRVAIWAQLEAKPGKEKELEALLKVSPAAGRARALDSQLVRHQIGPGKYGIFDTFADDQGRNAHLNGDIAKALFTKADELLVKPPQISKPDVLAVK